MRVGLIVNPIAGLGGPVGLKGTDGSDTVAEALRRGAVPRSGERAARAFALVARRVPGARITAAPGLLGADWVRDLDLAVTPTDSFPLSGTAHDTRLAVERMAGHDLIVFAGGDGTAGDVANALAPGMAMLGIPCGVKMHSGVFAVSPEAAGALIADLLSAPERTRWDDTAEVMDIDEDALHAGHIAPRLCGHVRVPLARNRIQPAKGGPRIDQGAALMSAACEIVEEMVPGLLYIIGPGTSAGAVMRAAGHLPTLLGVDAMRDGDVVARDAMAAELEHLAGDGPLRIIFGVTGRQGFLIGRGNQQITPALIRRAGREGLITLATEAKLTGLSEPRLWVDTGDAKLDAELAGFLRVRTGYRREMVMRVGAS